MCSDFSCLWWGEILFLPPCLTIGGKYVSNPFEADKMKERFWEKKTNLDTSCLLITIFRYLIQGEGKTCLGGTRLVLIFLWALKLNSTPLVWGRKWRKTIIFHGHAPRLSESFLSSIMWMWWNTWMYKHYKMENIFLDAIASLVFGHDCQSLTHGPFAITENFFNIDI